MSEIRVIGIENFQSHRKTVVHPAADGRLTVIVGPSDSGKTAIIRALRWLLYNAPQGIDFIRVGATFARVTLELADGTRVIRERGKSYNRYILLVPDAQQQVFEGFGGNVPLEIQEATGVKMATVGDLELALNLADQLAGPFLGSSVSAPARAKVLGKLAGTEEIDLAGKQLATDLHRRNQDEKRLTAELAGLEGKIAEYDYLPALVERIAALEAIVAAAKAAAGRRQGLAEKWEVLRQVDAGIAAAQVVLQRWQYLNLAEYTLSCAEKSVVQGALLRQAASKLRLAEEAISVAQGTLERLAGLEETQGIVALAEDASQSIKKLLSSRNTLIHLEDDLYWTRVGLEYYQGRLPEADEAAGSAASAAEHRIGVLRLGGLYRQVAAAIKQNEEKARCLAGMEEAEESLAQAGANRERQGKVIDLAGRLRQAEVERRKARDARVLWEQRVVDLEGAYSDALISMGKCPICGSLVNPENLKEVI